MPDFFEETSHLIVNLHKIILKVIYTRLIIGTLISALVMTSVSYLWHGVLLNDLYFIKYDIRLFFGLLVFVYLAVSLGISILLQWYKPKEKRIMKHTSIGVFIGFFMYLVTFIFGLSYQDSEFEHIVINFLWQMIEQGIGAFAISVYYIIAHRRERLLNFADVNED